MEHAAHRSAAAVLAALALGLVLGGCAGDEPAPQAGHSMGTSDAPRLAEATAGDLSLAGGFAYATTPMAGMDHGDDMSGMDMSDSPSMDSSGSGMDLPGGLMTAAFGTITNAGDTEDALIGVETDLTDIAQTHETVANEDGTGGTMRQVEEIVVPAGGSVRLEPGGYHIMLMDLDSDLAAGTTITLTLNFRSGTTMTVDFPVIDREDRP